MLTLLMPILTFEKFTKKKGFKKDLFKGPVTPCFNQYDFLSSATRG